MIDKRIIDENSTFFNILLNKPLEDLDKISETLEKLLPVNHKFHILEKIPEKELQTYLHLSDLVIVTKEINNQFLQKAFETLLPIIAVNVENTQESIALSINNEQPEKIGVLISLLFKNRKLRREIINHQIKKQNINPKILFQIEGSFDSSYSLAIVNREIAKALNKIYKGKVSLYSTDGYGDFPPNKEFLEKNQDIKQMYQLSQKALHAPVVMRNPYPPRVYDMKGVINCMTSYGWEESQYPIEFLENFNRYLDLLPVMSPSVEKVMIDNGIKIPVYTVGIGVDHILKQPVEKYPLKTKKKFKFLHISSCFPRKGIDVLIDAYTSAFTKYDDVVLIIKTFPNPHNNTPELIKYYQEKNKNYPEIELINKDIPDSQINYLYKISDCLVMPSRGEGFGMPAAEAMLYKKPVITTNYSGQTYFCNEETAILVDYYFEPSKSHMNLPNSYWATPKKEDLINKLKYVYKNKNSKEIKQKTEKAYHLIKTKFTWDKVVDRLLDAIEKTKKLPVFTETGVNLALMSTFNTKCGIATYTNFILENFTQDVNYTIIANKVSPKDILDKQKEEKVKRLWTFNLSNEEIQHIINTVKQKNINAFFIQHHFALYKTKQFGKLIEKLHTLNIPTFITLHTPVTDNKNQNLNQITNQLKRVTRIFVHSIKDLNILKEKYGLIDNVTLISHGVKDTKPDQSQVEKLKKFYNLQNKTVISTFGFLRKHKGILELIKAFEILKKEFPNLSLFLLNSLYPSEDSKQFLKECENYINLLPEDIKKDILLITNFIPDNDVINYLSVADVIVYPYHDVGESASGAVRYAIPTGKPIVTTPAKIFEDIQYITMQTKGYKPEDIADTIKKVLTDKTLQEKNRDKIKQYLKYTNWRRISDQIQSIINYFVTYQGKI